MNLNELIEQGEQASLASRKSGEFEHYYNGSDYENWLTLCIRYLNNVYPHDPETERFCEIARIANGFGDDKYHPLMGILKAFNAIPPVKTETEIMDVIENVCMNFIKFDRNIKRRHGGRSSISIEDEYDVQDSLLAIMKMFVDDIRPEDYVPSYAGSNSRVDFLIPDDQIVIEVKMTNNNLKDKQIGEQLIIDIARYKKLSGYNKLICFVYDKESLIINPTALKKDLENLSDEAMEVIVYISPL